MRQIPAIILGLAFVVLVGWYCQSRHSLAPQESGVGWISRKEAEKLLDKRILLESPADLQMRLNECPDVNVVVDGKLGPKSNEIVTNEFRDAYEKVFCWQQGIFECQMAGM